MELKVHDLLKINTVKDLIYDGPKPDWIEESINRAPFVVIRRAHSNGNLIPVGLRGTNRSERFAAFIHVNDFIDAITPEQIVKQRAWINYEERLFSYLEEIKHLMDERLIDWGPVGSVGFELVSQVPTINEKSDIDIVIRYTSQLTSDTAKMLNNRLNELPVPIDVQVETLEGSFSLREYANSEEQPILFKTKDGPMLKRVSDLAKILS